MSELITGLIIFFGIHLLPSFPDMRRRLVTWKGEGIYTIGYSLTALIGLLLIILGKNLAPVVLIYYPPTWATSVNWVLMGCALILLPAAYLPSNLKRFLRHPFLLGVAFWAVAHLLVNGDLSSLLLFASFALFALFDMWSSNRRGAALSQDRLPFWRDGILVATGTAAYIAIAYLHPLLFGVAVHPY